MPVSLLPSALPSCRRSVFRGALFGGPHVVQCVGGVQQLGGSGLRSGLAYGSGLHRARTGSPGHCDIAGYEVYGERFAVNRELGIAQPVYLQRKGLEGAAV